MLAAQCAICHLPSRQSHCRPLNEQKYSVVLVTHVAIYQSSLSDQAELKVQHSLLLGWQSANISAHQSALPLVRYANVQ